MMIYVIFSSRQWRWLWWFWYFSGALLSKDQWMADSGSYAWIQVYSPAQDSSYMLSLFWTLLSSFPMTLSNFSVCLCSWDCCPIAWRKFVLSFFFFSGLAVPSLPTRVAFMSVVASARTRSIYLYFPRHQHPPHNHHHVDEQAILSSVECYDPETDKWTKLVHMKKVDTHFHNINLQTFF